MNEKTFAAVALTNADFPSFEAKLEEAARWTRFAAHQGADLVVLTEALNSYAGDGDPDAFQPAKIALDDWQRQTATLLKAAREARVAVTVPIIERKKNGQLVNNFYVVDADGTVLGEYQKTCPTPYELKDGIVPGKSKLIEWQGIKIGGGICFDVHFQDVFENQADAGAQIFLIPSLTPGGSYLNQYALSTSTPMVLAYPAYSRIVDLDGTEIVGGGYRHETLRFGFGSPVILATINFDRTVLYANHNQEKIVAIQDKYGSKVRVKFDQEHCLFVLESRDNDLTVNQIIKEFGLIPQRQYFKESAGLLKAAAGR